MKFINKSQNDVYVDLGTLLRVAPGEVIELAGAVSCPPLEPIFEPPQKPAKKKAVKTVKNTSTSGTI